MCHEQICLWHCTYVPLHYDYILHIDSTLLYIQLKKNLQQVFSETDMPLKWHICQLLHVQIWDNYVSTYTSYDNSMQSIMRPGALVYIHFTLQTHVTEQICMPHYTCPTTLLHKLHIQTSHYWTYQSKINKMQHLPYYCKNVCKKQICPSETI